MGSLQCHNRWDHKSAKVQWEPQHMSPLVAAIYSGHTLIIMSLFQDFQDRSSNSTQKNTVASGKVTYDTLTLAVCMDNDSFEILHAAASDEEIKANGHWLLLSALEQRRNDIFKTLVNDPRVELTSRTSISQRESPGRTILTAIARRGDIDSLRSLLELLQTDRRNEIMTLLPDESDEDQCSPLWYAADLGHTEVVEALCSLDPDTIRPQLLCHAKFGVYIIAAAARGGDRRIVEALLKVCLEYADRFCTDNDTPLSMTK
jgi:ankyrin repeat protein